MGYLNPSSVVCWADPPPSPRLIIHSRYFCDYEAIIRICGDANELMTRNAEVKRQIAYFRKATRSLRLFVYYDSEAIHLKSQKRLIPKFPTRPIIKGTDTCLYEYLIHYCIYT